MIRLSRRGARKQPYYRIVVIEKDRARDGRSVEVVGTYNPRTNPASIELKRERIDYWTSKGAQLSDRVRKLVEKAPAASTPEATPVAEAAAGSSCSLEPASADRALDGVQENPTMSNSKPDMVALMRI